MSDKRQFTEDEMFGPRKPKQFTEDEMFGPKPVDADMSGPIFAEQLSPGMGTYAATVLDQFGQGASRAWGSKPLGADPHYFENSLLEEMKRRKIDKPLQEADDAVTEQLNAIQRSIAVGIDKYLQGMVGSRIAALGDLAIRGPYALARGLAETATPLAVPGAVASTLIEGFAPELLPHLPRTPDALRAAAEAPSLLDRGVTAAEAGIQRGVDVVAQTPLARRLTGAFDLGITTEDFPMTAHEEVIQNLRPKGAGPTETVIAPATVPTERLPPTNIHEAARRIDPEGMGRFDELTQERETRDANLKDLRETAEKEAQTALDAFMEPINERGGLLTRAEERKRSSLEENLRKAREEETPEMRDERFARDRAERSQLSMSDVVREAYTKAREQFPDTPAVSPVDPQFHATLLDSQGRQFTIEPNPGGGFDVTGPNGKSWSENFAGAMRQVDASKAAGEVDKFLAPGTSIADHITAKGVLAGRPIEDARLIGDLWQAYYENRAQAFKGTRGTGRDMFNEERPDIQFITQAESGVKVPRGRIARGFTDLARSLIGLTEHQNASTLIHESAHFFLSNLVKDAAHPDAPPGMKADMSATLEWLKSKGNITETMHEQWAKGFERYVMEGQAPSTALARVFEQFKQLLTDIYQKLSAAGRINDTMRGVYDRLLAKDTRETIITPDATATMRDLGLLQKDFDVLHQEDAARLAQNDKAKPEDLARAADLMRAERDSVGETMTTEFNNGRRRARTSGAFAAAVREARRLKAEDIARRDAERAGVAPGDETGLGSEPVREGNVTEDGKVVVGGAVDKTPVPSNPREGFQPAATRVTNADGSARIENIWTPDDALKAIRIDDSLGPKEPLTERQAVDLAEAIGVSVDEVMARGESIGKAYTKEEIDRLTKMITAAEAHLHDLMRVLDDEKTPDRALEMAQSISRVEMLHGLAFNAGGEWGLAGQALQRLKAATGVSTGSILNSLLHRVTGRDYESLLQLAALGRNLNSTSAIGQLVRGTRQEMSPFGRGVVWWMVNSFLSGTNTHAVYLAGNEIRAILLGPAETAVSATVGAFREALGVGPQDRVYFREVGAQLRGLGMGTWAGLRPAWEAYKAGQQQPLPGATTAHGNPFLVSSPFGPVLTNTVGQPLKVVSAIHQFGLVQFYTQYLYQYATRTAIDEGLSGYALSQRIADLQSHPTPALMAEARDLAQQAMYQRVTPYGSLGRSMAAWTDRYAMTKAAFPFTKIGFEMVRETLAKRTPLGLVDSQIRQDLGLGDLGLGAIGVRGGRPGTMVRGGAKFDEQVGKWILGTGMFAGGLFFAAQGITQGHGPDDIEESETHAGRGQPYSINIGPWSVPLGGLGAPGNLLKFAADVWEVSHHAKQQELEEMAVGYFKAVERAIFDEGFLHSAMSLFDAFKEPGKYGLRFVTNLAMGLVPYGTAISQINREWIDPYSKEIAPGLAGLFDMIRARFPGLSKNVPNKPDMFGEPIPSRGIRYTRHEDDPVYNWLKELGIYPGKIDRSVWGVRLTEEQYNQFEQLAGMYTKEFLTGAVEGGVQDMTKGGQIWYLGRQTQRARKFARQQVAIESADKLNDIVAKAHKLRTMKWTDEPPRLGFKPELD